MILQFLQNNPIFGMVVSFVTSFVTFTAKVSPGIVGVKEVLGIIATVIGILIGVVTLALKIQEYNKNRKNE